MQCDCGCPHRCFVDFARAQNFARARNTAQRNENCRACSRRRRDNKISRRRMYATVLWTKLLNTSSPLVYDAGHARCLKAARLITNWRDGGNKNESRASSPLICRIFSGKKHAHPVNTRTCLRASERANEFAFCMRALHKWRSMYTRRGSHDCHDVRRSIVETWQSF